MKTYNILCSKCNGDGTIKTKIETRIFRMGHMPDLKERWFWRINSNALSDKMKHEWCGQFDTEQDALDNIKSLLGLS